MPRPRSAKEVSCETKSAAELLGLHLCESCSKLNEDCRKKVDDENANEQLKGITEDVGELKLIVRTTDELVDAFKSKEVKLKSFNRT